MRWGTRVRKRNRLIGNKYAHADLNWRRLGPAGWQQFVPVPSSMSLHAFGTTVNPQRRRGTVNIPGPVDPQFTWGQRPGPRQYPPGTDDVAVAEIECRTCHMRPRSICETATGKPAARPHKARRDAAADLIESRSTTPGGRSTRRGPIRPLGQLLSRILGGLLVVALAWLYALVLGADTWVDVFEQEVQRR